ncbi:MAG: MBL fold metallo-hydrolase [Anaerolineae bacterium]|nr:MBL fold metallo-hydrolase [Anaerolineae bacterium]
MLLKYFYDKRLAQASYLIGCSETGQAMIVDPIRTIAPYLKASAEHGLRITHITETHIHADFTSGTRELATATGGTMYLSDMGDADWKYQFAKEDGATLVRDGDQWMVGNIKVEVMHTPGHTPEHICFVITDTAGADRPMGIFTGDFIFVGDVGRPDLLEMAAGFVGTKEIGARQQFHSVQRAKKLPDYLQLWPGHGAGSACGKALGAIPSTTLGYEKLFNPAFQIEEEDAFVDWLLADQPEAPRYFAQMKKVNKQGPTLLKDVPAPMRLEQADLQRALVTGELVIDARREKAFIKAHVAGTISIPATSNSFSTYVGWFVDYNAPLYLIVEAEASVASMVEALRDIGVDHVAGYATVDDLQDVLTDHVPTMKAEELAQRMKTEPITIIDVRSASEFKSMHLPGAVNIPFGLLPQRLGQLPKTGPLVLHCASGYRSLLATSWLRKHGFTNVIDLNDKEANWSKLVVAEMS